MVSYKLSMGEAKQINLTFKLRLPERDGISGSGSKEESLVNWFGKASKNRVWLLGVVSKAEHSNWMRVWKA